MWKCSWRNALAISVPALPSVRESYANARNTRLADVDEKSARYGFLGTNPTNQEWYGSRPLASRNPNSAVPDLPATLIGMSTRLYVWRSVTVDRPARRIAFSVACETFIFRIRSGLNGVITDPSGPITSRTSWGRYRRPPFASAAYALISWIGVTPSSP